MLVDSRRDIEKNYYDPKLRGIDLAATIAAAKIRVEAATSTAEAIDAVSAVFDVFKDSHTQFYPPPRATRVDYGWRMAAVGEAPLVMTVDPASDAARQGLAAGDRVLAINRFVPTRATIRQITHYYGVVRPQIQQRVTVRTPDGTERAFDIQSKAQRREIIQLTDAFEEALDSMAASDDSYGQVDPDIAVWRMTEFRDAEAMGRGIAQARKGKTLVLDLRGNPGGELDGLRALVGLLCEREVVVMTRVSREGEKVEVAKPKGKRFPGKLIVLIDSRSASASECLARIVQIEKRGTVVGDRSSGLVMVSEQFGHAFGIGRSTFYGTSVTVSDIRMSDGNRLEGVGVTPDEVILPAPADLAAGRDPVLARAITLAGGTMSPEQAGKLALRQLGSR
jgi:C-terminal processing protease CtpA/Prc